MDTTRKAAIVANIHSVTNKVNSGAMKAFESLKSVKYTVVTVAIIITVIIAVIVVAVWWYSSKDRKTTSFLKSLYKFRATMFSIDDASTNDRPLRHFYVKTSYNSCCGGDYKNDYVSTETLGMVIGQGYRCLDFEIYSVGGVPVISASSDGASTASEQSTGDKYSSATTFNKIPLSDAMKTIVNHGFNESTVTNHADPIFLNLRINSAKTSTYSAIADILKGYTDKLLDSRFNYNEYTSKGFSVGDLKMKLLMGKIIIMVTHDSNIDIGNTGLGEFCHIVADNRTFRGIEVSDINTKETIIEENHNILTIVYPTKGPVGKNYNPMIAIGTGCAMPAVVFQDSGEELDAYNEFFGQSAFKPKPKELLPPVTEVKVAEVRNITSSYAADMVVNGPLGGIKI